MSAKENLPGAVEIYLNAAQVLRRQISALADRWFGTNDQVEQAQGYEAMANQLEGRARQIAAGEKISPITNDLIR